MRRFGLTWPGFLAWRADSEQRGHCASRCCCASSPSIDQSCPAGRTSSAAFDIFQVIQPRQATERPVVIVDIDEKSLRALGQWPWPRTRIAEMITRLTNLGALVIAFDVVFAEPDRLSRNLRRIRFAISMNRHEPSFVACQATIR